MCFRYTKSRNVEMKVVGVALNGHGTADDIIDSKVVGCQKKQLVGGGADQPGNSSHDGSMPHHSVCCLLFTILLFSAL